MSPSCVICGKSTKSLKSRLCKEHQAKIQAWEDQYAITRPCGRPKREPDVPPEDSEVCEVLGLPRE